jgi:hypothetical protein
MADGIDIPAWIALFIGLYSASAAIGELRHPGGWVGMVAHFERLGLGAAIYLVSPWRPGDWLAVLVTVIGGGMVVEGALILAFGDNFLAFARRLMGAANRLWAGLSLLLGAALIVVALLRL